MGVYCGQTAGWMNTPLGTEVDLGPGHIVLDGDPPPPCERGTAGCSPLFSARLLWPRTTVAHLSYCWAVVDIIFVFSVLAKRLAWKSISEMTYFHEWDVKR